MQAMKRAVIDIGTNSTLFLSGELDKECRVRNIKQVFNVTRLGEGVLKTGIITEKAMERTIKTLTGYAEEVNRSGVSRVYVLGTQVLRIAKNAADFKRLIKSRFNWDLEILSEEQEAKYSFIGACDVIGQMKKKVIVMDTGGGSTEIIIGVKDRIISYQSLPLGAVNLAEISGMKDMLTEEDRQNLSSLLVQHFYKSSLCNNINNRMILIGVGGTITTLAAIEKKLTAYQPGKINGTILTKNIINLLFDYLNGLSLKDRKKIPGLTEGREDIILFGTIIFLTFMELFGLKRIIVSDRGLRFGYLKWIGMNQ